MLYQTIPSLFWFMLTDSGFSRRPQLLILARHTALRRVMLVPDFFHLQMMEATVVVGAVSPVVIWISWLGLFSDMQCQVWDLL